MVAGGTLVDGAVKNVRYAFMENLEIWVAVLDPTGKAVARCVSFLLPHRLNLDDTAPFDLHLPVPVQPGTRLRFTYTYIGGDGGNGAGSGGDGTYWLQSFDAVVPAR